MKAFKLHRLILATFNPVEGMEELDCNHINENKADNRIENLEWVSHKDNCNYGTRNQRIKDGNIKTKQKNC